MLAYIPAPWILWVWIHNFDLFCRMHFFSLCWPIMRNMSLLVITADPHAKVAYLGTVEASYSWCLFSTQHVNSQIQPSAKMFQCGFQHVHATKLQTWCVSNNHNFNPRFLLISTPKGPYHSRIPGCITISLHVHQILMVDPPINSSWVLDSHQPPWFLSFQFHCLLLLLTYLLTNNLNVLAVLTSNTCLISCFST